MFVVWSERRREEVGCRPHFLHDWSAPESPSSLEDLQQHKHSTGGQERLGVLCSQRLPSGVQDFALRFGDQRSEKALGSAVHTHTPRGVETPLAARSRGGF